MKSRSQDGLWYAVDLEDRGGSCTCRGFEIRKACRHLAAVRALVAGTAATAADDAPHGWDGQLATSRYQSGELIVRSGLVPVRITLGHPRFALRGYRVAAVVKEAAPKGLAVGAGGEFTFTRSYRARLEAFGVAWFQRRFASILRDARRDPEASVSGLVLLCYEDLTKPGEFCHRRVFADWWLEQTGQEVPELGDLAVQAELA